MAHEVSPIGFNMSRYTIIVVAVLASALGALGQDPKPRKIAPPEEVVAAYFTAIADGDLAALAKTYTRPLEGIYRSLAAFRAEHRKLIAATVGLFGKAGATEVDDKRYNVTLPPILSGKVGVAVIKKNRAAVSVSLTVKGQKEPHATKMILELQKREWRIVQVGAKPLPVPVRPEASIVEWDVAAEATRRILKFLSRNKVKSASDIVSLRKSYMQIVTKEWTLAQKLGKRPASHPTSPPPRRPGK